MTVPDRICVTGIRGVGYHGVLERERVEGQEFNVDVTMIVDTYTVAASDDLADTVDYSAVAEAVHAFIVGPPMALIETLAARIADRCMDFDGVRGVIITVHKPQAPIAVPFDDVSVTIERGSNV
ncbi:MAG: dihydroneopterin aldolase [Candidatus Nanopelagicales bacterium]|jgi:dihydroneopterin aldolase|nr:dihydroneopterin aldolase [Candidatus Nanopelagicales bacterium]